MEKGRLKKLIIPLILEQLLAVSVGVIDTFMVSKVGEEAVAGVSLVDNINVLIIQVMAAFAAGGIVVISQYLGTDNKKMAQKSAAQLEMIIAGFTVFIMATLLIFGKFILKALFPDIEPEVMANSRIYLSISALSFVFWGFYTSGSAILRCNEDTKTSMKISILMNVMNAVLNALFVFVVKWGVLGVAVATLISRAVAGVSMKVIISSGRNKLRADSIRLYKLTGDIVRKILSMAIPSGIENGMFHVGKIIVAGMISGLGTSVIAANSISYQIIEFPNIPGNTIGLALMVIVGQEIGAGRKDNAYSYSKRLIKYAYFGDWGAKALLFLVAPIIVGFFPLSSAGTAAAILVLRCFSIASIAIWPLSFTMPQALKGAGDVRYSMIVGVLSMWFGRVLASYIMVKVFNLGILGVWTGMFIDWYIRGISFFIRFRSKKWLDKKVV